ncbi:MAG: TCP-1/cpn60 chaperonin family protein, partial [Dehalococcoidia bacterium]|nr:TCP-1/cpn60 chaperonin family protein [Dehalococcoidia bacterium]
MGVKDILYGDDVRYRMLRGVRVLARAVGATMGPRGQNVIIDKPGMSPTVTFDGVTVGKEISLEDTWEDIGVRLCKEVSGHTNEASGDGTTTATIL